MVISTVESTDLLLAIPRMAPQKPQSQSVSLRVVDMPPPMT